MKTKFRQPILVLLVLAMLSSIGGLFSIYSARADTFSWMQGDITGKVVSSGPPAEKCIKQKVRIGSTQGEEAEICVYQAQGWRYGIWTHVVSNGSGDQQIGEYVVSFGSDTAMYTVSGIPAQRFQTPIHVSNSNNLIYHTYIPNSSYAHEMRIIKDLPSKLERVSLGGFPAKTGYQLKQNASEPLIKDESGNLKSSYRSHASDNGRWLVVELRPGGFVRIDMKTFEMQGFTKYIPTYGQGSDPTIEFAVSDDGKRVATTGTNMDVKIYELDDLCGWTGPTVPNNYLDAAMSECPKRDVYGIIDQTRGGDTRFIVSPSFDSEAGELTVRTVPFDRPNVPFEEKWVTLRASNYTPSPYLDYLALGDSYSSGEGDVGKKDDGKSYYTPVSDYMNGCHLSVRSYPFQLQTIYNISASKMNSIACSGAVIQDIRFDGVRYLGQGERLKDFNDYDLLDRQEYALEAFNPGDVEQVKFVEKYKPKAITLTIGGNDVGFAKIVRACVNTDSLFTCSAAKEYGLRGQLGWTIRSQFASIVNLIKSLQKASPETRVYLVGYPQFIYSGTAICGINVGITDSEEREMMVEGVHYMNEIIKSAAYAAGVVYIDIENSLIGGRMCETSEYVTGLADIGVFNSQEYPSTFHPNASGHGKIAGFIKRQLGDYNLLDYPYAQRSDDSIQAATPTPYFARAMASYDRSAHYETMTDQPAIKTQPIDVSGSKFTLKEGSVLRFKSYSDPIDLGAFTANADGGFNVSITFPSTIPAGFHTLVLSGESYSGELIDIYQVVEVKGSDPNDRDEDGISDNIDPCKYIPASNVDIDQDRIDDACDPEIGPPPVPRDPYRIRAGDSTRQYAGMQESSNTLYLERSIHAVTKTGIVGDYDSDNDGWVVIASGKNNLPTGPYAHFWIDGAETSKTPHVSFRTAENGCVQYKTTDLSRITEANNMTPRTFTIEAQDAATCRSEPPEADLDSNGQPDNTQALYRARKGDSSIKHVRPDGSQFAEDSSKIYLERSVRAAEVQLGKSDYAINDPVTTPSTISVTDTTDYRPAWNIIAVTQYPHFSLNNFVKIKFINNFPHVLAGYSSFFYTNCTVYKPDNLATIKRTTQYTRQLQIDLMQTFMIQGGCNV